MTTTTQKKILIVDDDQYIRELYEEIFTNVGYHVETAVDGKIGLDKIMTKTYDIVLLDVMMPTMDGIEVLRRLHEKHIKPFPRIILLTNLAHDPIIKEAKEKGVIDCIIKADLNPDELVKKITSYL